MSKLKIGVMGAIRGSEFMNTLRFMEDAELVAVCENNEKIWRELNGF